MRTSSAARSFVSQYPKTTALVTVAGVGLFGLKKWMAGGVCHSKARLDGKTVLITGANTGIGKETAVDMARRGARVILACRDMERANKAAEEVKKRSGNDSVIVRKLDLASLQSIRQLAKDILASEERLDVLINNAGIMSCPKWKTEDGFEMQFGVNHLGHFLLTNCLLDLLKKSAPSRIVNVSSLAHERGTGVTAYSLHPGVIRTELGRHFWPTVPLWKRVLYVPFVFFIKNPTEGAQTTIYCAVEESLQNESGLYYSDCAPKTAAPQGLDDEAAKKLWELSASVVGLT
ncbi:retinol dehydrogenase 13-like isoform X4 [Simochromis diagramma]|uniref:retinol dehydrogenase 13-like isoform X4 n=1 Tax=Simochromis diagramma TaxID=43689 RepID=UPI001A7E4EF6|nr:retinol dehydrogenase 13-like isoform X4 [Simochromis diagramma]